MQVVWWVQRLPECTQATLLCVISRFLDTLLPASIRYVGITLGRDTSDQVPQYPTVVALTFTISKLAKTVVALPPPTVRGKVH